MLGNRQVAWLVALSGLCASCGSVDVAELGETEPQTLCTMMYAGDGFALVLAFDQARQAELESSTFSLCRNDEPCHSQVIHTPQQGDRWTGEETKGYVCGSVIDGGSLLITADLDENVDPSAAKVADGDVWRGLLTDAYGQDVAGYEGAVQYTARCINGTAECGVSYWAAACQSDGVGVCPDLTPTAVCDPYPGPER